MLFINGEWRDAASGATFESHNPATGEVIGTRGRRRRRRRPGGRRRRRRRVRGVVDPHRLRAVGVPRPGPPAHARAARGAGQAHDRGAGQADPHGPQRGRVRGRLPALVRGGGQAGLRGDHPVGPRRPALPRAAPAGRRGRGDHAVELPGVDADAEDRAGAGGGLHDRAQAGRADAAARGRDVQAARGGRAARGRREPDHHLRPRDRRPRARAAPEGAQDHLHRLDRGRASSSPSRRRRA